MIRTISIAERITIISTLLSILKSEGLTLTAPEKKTIKEVMLEHVTYLQAGIVDNLKKDTEEK